MSSSFGSFSVLLGLEVINFHRGARQTSAVLPQLPIVQPFDSSIRIYFFGIALELGMVKACGFSSDLLNRRRALENLRVVLATGPMTWKYWHGGRFLGMS